MLLTDKIKRYVDGNFKKLGVNKKNQIQRLLYEISKSQNIDFKKILGEYNKNRFSVIKKELLKKRFPASSLDKEKFEPYLPYLSINPEYKVRIKPIKAIYPKNIYFEKNTAKTIVLDRFKKAFPHSLFKEIPSLKEFTKDTQKHSIELYNKRRDNFFIVNENFDFFKKCPCSAGCIHCGYAILNLGFGCPYECAYCYLQIYSNSPGIIISANIDKYLNVLKNSISKYKRIGTGEFADSLAFDNITGFSSTLIKFFSKYPEITFEFKTKSNNIKNILNTKLSSNIVVAWSLNPKKIIDKNEFYSASLSERINAAKKCAAAGYKVAFHFDPVIYYNGWEDDYRDTVNFLFDNIPSEKIVWISIGALRSTKKLKKIIENRYPDADILDSELLIGFDEKLRYSDSVRIKIYKNMINWIRERSSATYIYLCMEKKKIWKECNISATFL